MENDLQDRPREEVRGCSRNWIAKFNKGDATACVAAYKHIAIMHATPLGTFNGKEAIEGFWRPFMASGAGQLVYDNIRLRVVDESTVVLSADWGMNVGRWVITMGKWVKQSGGNWLLEQDDFEVVEQFKQ